MFFCLFFSLVPPTSAIQRLECYLLEILLNYNNKKTLHLSLLTNHYNPHSREHLSVTKKIYLYNTLVSSSFRGASVAELLERAVAVREVSGSNPG